MPKDRKLESSPSTSPSMTRLSSHATHNTISHTRMEIHWRNDMLVVWPRVCSYSSWSLKSTVAGSFLLELISTGYRKTRERGNSCYYLHFSISFLTNIIRGSGGDTIRGGIVDFLNLRYRGTRSGINRTVAILLRAGWRDREEQRRESRVLASCLACGRMNYDRQMAQALNAVLRCSDFVIAIIWLLLFDVSNQ